MKQKDVASSPRLPPSVAAASKPTLDTATANVTARLYNAKPVKDAIIGVVPTIRAALGLDNRPRVEKAAEVGSRENERSTSGQAQPQIASSKHTVQDDSLSDYYSVSDNEMFEEEDNQVPTGNGRADLDVSDDSEALAGLDARVAGSSDEDEPGDSAHLRDGAGSDASSQSSSVSEAAVNPPPPKRRESGKQNERATAKFMPSLTMGGYVEGSDSDPEPFDDQPQRKNRRGQRARQAIWEKKFGKGAKHLQKDAAKTGKGAGPGKRDEGWDPKRGAHSGSTAPSKGYKPRWQQDREQRKRSGEDAASGGNAMELGPRKASKKLSHEPQGLHPSWEAAKRVKEQKQQGASFSGRKMVFD